MSEIFSNFSNSLTSLTLNFSICLSNLNCCKNCFCFSACSILRRACSFLKNNFISFVLCFSNLISSFKACSFNFTLNSTSFCFSFAISIFSNLSLSCFSNLTFLASSFLRILYCKIVSDILSKNAWIYFSILKFIWNFISGFNEFWKLITFKIKPDFFSSLVLNFFNIFFDLIILNLLLIFFILRFDFFIGFLFIFFGFVFIFFGFVFIFF